MLAIPLEIYGLVAEYVSRDDLINLSCVSLDFRIEFERLLYRTIQVQKYTPTTDRLLERISGTPRLSLSVRTFHIIFKDKIQSHTTRKLSSTLRAMKNLTELHFVGHNLQVHVLTRQCTFQLHGFKYLENAPRGSATKSLGNFLLLQPLIRHLSIPIYDNAVLLPSDMLPHLDTLDAPGFLATALDINRRPIQRLRWRSDQSYLKLHGAFSTILVLVINDYPNKVDFPAQFPNLRLLECQMRLKHVSSLALFHMKGWSFNTIQDKLASIVGLHYLHTLRDSGGLTVDFDTQEVDSIWQGLGDVMKSLYLVQVGTLQRHRGGQLESRQDAQPWYEWMV